MTVAYIRVEMFSTGESGFLRTRGYIQGDIDPRLLALVARDSLLALRNRRINTNLTDGAIADLDSQLDIWNIDDSIHPDSGNWRGERLSDWIG